MKKLLNSKGFSIVEVLIALAVTGLIGGAGWYVYKAQQNEQLPKSSSPMSTDKLSTSESISPQKRTFKDQSEYYQITLPTGWKLSTDKPSGVVYEDAYTYTDTSGKSLHVYVNVGAVGGSGDAFSEYQVVNGKIVINIENMSRAPLCTSPGSYEDGSTCTVGDGKLFIMSSSDKKIKSNNYLFVFQDDKSESLASSSVFKELVESIRFQ